MVGTPFFSDRRTTSIEEIGPTESVGPFLFKTFQQNPTISHQYSPIQ